MPAHGDTFLLYGTSSSIFADAINEYLTIEAI